MYRNQEVNLTDLINDRAGLLSSLKKIKPLPGLPQLKRYLSTINMIGLKDQVTITGSGFSLDESEAKWAATGEAIERYCASTFYDRKKLTVSSYNELTKKAVEPISITRLTTKQYKEQNFYNNVSNDSQLLWINGVNLITKETTLVPVDLVHLSLPPYKPIREILSTGLACAQSLEKAISSALCECIERDAFSLFWLLEKVNFQIDLNSSVVPDDINNLLRVANNSNLDVLFFDITQDNFPPTIITIVRMKGRKGFYIGCASDFKYTNAIKKALNEGLGGYSVIFEKVFHYNYEVPNSYHEISKLEEGALFYITGEGDKILDDILMENKVVKRLEDLANQNTNLISTLNNLNLRGHNAYFFDLTTPDFRSLGFHVVRVVTPTLSYLSFEKPLLNCNRLREKAKQLNKTYNLIPHPLP